VRSGNTGLYAQMYGTGMITCEARQHSYVWTDEWNWNDTMESQATQACVHRCTELE